MLLSPRKWTSVPISLAGLGDGPQCPSLVAIRIGFARGVLLVAVLMTEEENRATHLTLVLKESTMPTPRTYIYDVKYPDVLHEREARHIAIVSQDCL